MNVKLRPLRATRPQIPVSSTGDIAFLVIIFFLSTSVFSRYKGLKLLLPEGEPTPMRNVLVLSVNQEGMVRLGSEDRTVNVDQLRDVASEALVENEKTAFVLRISRKSPYGVMVRAFDQLRMAGATRIALDPVRAGME